MKREMKQTKGARQTVIAILFVLLFFYSCSTPQIIEVNADSPRQVRMYSGFIPEDMEDAKFERLVYDRAAREAVYYMQFSDIDASAVDMDSLHQGMHAKVVGNIRTIPNMISMAEDEVRIEYLFKDRYGIEFYSRGAEPKIYRRYNRQQP